MTVMTSDQHSGVNCGKNLSKTCSFAMCTFILTSCFQTCYFSEQHSLFSLIFVVHSHPSIYSSNRINFSSESRWFRRLHYFSSNISYTDSSNFSIHWNINYNQLLNSYIAIQPQQPQWYQFKIVVLHFSLSFQVKPKHSFPWMNPSISLHKNQYTVVSILPPNYWHSFRIRKKLN